MNTLRRLLRDCWNSVRGIFRSELPDEFRCGWAERVAQTRIEREDWEDVRDRLIATGHLHNPSCAYKRHLGYAECNCKGVNFRHFPECAFWRDQSCDCLGIGDGAIYDKPPMKEKTP